MMPVDQRNIETDLRDAAAARGAIVTDRGNGHFQIRGRLLVNYYPFAKTRTAYVAATTHGRKHISPTEAVDMAFYRAHEAERAADRAAHHCRELPHQVEEAPQRRWLCDGGEVRSE